MAEAHGQLTGRPAVCLATRAVGAANLAIGIHTARADSTPMLAIVGGVQRGQRGREAFQEADLVGSIGRLAKWAVEIDTPSRADALIAEAIRHAMAGRPGPVFVAIPEDVLDELVPGATGEIQPFRADPGRARARRRPRRPPAADLRPPPGDPRRGRRAPLARDRGPGPAGRDPRGPGHLLVASRRRLPQRPPALPRDDRARCPVDASASASTPPMPSP